MIGIVGKRTAYLALAMAGLSAFASGAVAQSNCDAYARLTLEQAKKNVALGCGFKGARWSLNVGAHKKWCQDVGPAQWRAELKNRTLELTNNCKK